MNGCVAFPMKFDDPRMYGLMRPIKLFRSTESPEAPCVSHSLIAEKLDIEDAPLVILT